MVDFSENLRDNLRGSQRCVYGTCDDCDTYEEIQNGSESSHSSALLKDPVLMRELAPLGLTARKTDSLISTNIKDLVSPMVWME